VALAAIKLVAPLARSTISGAYVTALTSAEYVSPL
jgi:hypothetical protein